MEQVVLVALITSEVFLEGNRSERRRGRQGRRDSHHLLLVDLVAPGQSGTIVMRLLGSRFARVGGEPRGGPAAPARRREEVAAVRRRVGGGAHGGGVFDDVHALVWRVEGRGDGAVRVQREPREREDEEKRDSLVAMMLPVMKKLKKEKMREEEEEWGSRILEREE